MPNDSDANLTDSFTSEPSLAALRQEAMQRLRNGLRVGQQSMADWQGGALAVSAVPGAGKSTGMAVAAALAIARYQLNARRQLIIVTFTRSAAANIKAKVRESLRKLSIPQNGFVVYTLHGLALNIASRHPDLSGLNLDTATVITPNQNHRLIKACVDKWIAANPRRYALLLEGTQFDGEETERLRRQSVLRTEVLPSIANTVIHEAKSSGLLPNDLWAISEQTTDHYGILAIAAGLYEQYEKSARERDNIDYDDMILAALRVLENDSARQIWQQQVFAVFEDEAQDSSPLQTKLLEILAAHPESRGAGGAGEQGAGEQGAGGAGEAGEAGENSTNYQSPITHHLTIRNYQSPITHHPSPALNLVRVGDPNQAINSTFTPADPIYFRRFCQECSQQGRLAKMERAGRSSRIIIDAANFVLDWVNRNYAHGDEKPFSRQMILPVDPGDPQPDGNPPPVGRGLEIYTPRDVHHTVELIAERVIELFAQAPDSQAAVLVRENRQGSFVAAQLEFLRREHGIAVYDVGQGASHSHVPVEILTLLQFLDRPHSPDYLKAALEILVKRELIPTQDLNALATLPEQFLYPGPLDAPQTALVRQACRFCRSLLRARLELPHYQLIPFLALSLNYDQSELATADKLAERVAKQTFSNSSMKATLEALREIITSERFEAVETGETDDRYMRKGQITIITMHKAKGLDWDYVFMPFLHEDTLPGSPWVPTAAQFLGDFTLAEVARAQIRASLHGNYPLPLAESAWGQAGYLKTAEEFRLLYVAMTRAKRLLWMSAAQQGPFRWNTFNSNQGDNLQEKKPCPVLTALKSRFPHSQSEAIPRR